MEAIRRCDLAAQLHQVANMMTARLILNNDTDGDGVLSVHELMVSEDISAQIDKDGDGRADREELNVAYLRGVDNGTSRVIQNNDTDGDGALNADELGVTDALFGEVDKNDDGQADRKELNAFYPQAINHMTTTLIQNNDTNSDGVLSSEELTIPQDAFARIDQNDDGQASRKELNASYPQTHHVTNQLIEDNDTNGDGVLSADELAGPQKLFEIIDVNDDGQIDRRELNTFI